MKLLNSVLLVSSLLLTPAIVSAPAEARAGVSIDFGNVAIGYRDGYYDHGHRYHSWRHHDADSYRSQYHDNYRDMYHTRDHNRSWTR